MNITNQRCLVLILCACTWSLSGQAQSHGGGSSSHSGYYSPPSYYTPPPPPVYTPPPVYVAPPIGAVSSDSLGNLKGTPSTTGGTKTSSDESQRIYWQGQQQLNQTIQNQNAAAAASAEKLKQIRDRVNAYRQQPNATLPSTINQSFNGTGNNANRGEPATHNGGVTWDGSDSYRQPDAEDSEAKRDRERTAYWMSQINTGNELGLKMMSTTELKNRIAKLKNFVPTLRMDQFRSQGQVLANLTAATKATQELISQREAQTQKADDLAARLSALRSQFSTTSP